MLDDQCGSLFLAFSSNRATIGEDHIQTRSFICEYINSEKITKSYTERKMLEEASFYLQEGEKVGVIGINGTGKSTLLKIMAGYEEPDGGTVVRANNLVIHYLPQDPEFDPEDDILTSVEKLAAHHGTSSEQMEAKAMMTRLGITDFTQKNR